MRLVFLRGGLHQDRVQLLAGGGGVRAAGGGHGGGGEKGADGIREAIPKCQGM